MTGRRPIRSSVLSRLLPRRVRAGAPATGALALCAALVAGCGVVPGATAGSGDGPITVMTWAPERTGATDKPGMPAFARAYARWVNERGGLDGRPLRVLTCNERNDSVTAARCARRAVEEDAVAVVGSYSQHTDAFLTTLEGAGIPYIGGYGLTDDEFTSPLSYPVNGGLPTLLAGLGRTLADRCGPVALVRPDTIAGDRLPALLDSGLRAGGHAPTGDRRAPEDATSYDDEVRHALEGAAAGPGRPGCVVPALGDGTRTFMDSFRRARRAFPEVRTGTVLGSVDQSTVDASGGASGPYEGSFVTGWYPHAGDARWEPLRKVVEEAAFGDNRIDPGDAGVQTTWIAYTVLRQAVESLGGGEVSARTVHDALRNGLEVTTGGLTPPLSWSFQGRLAAVGYPRLANAQVSLQVVRDGRLVSAREGFTDVTRTLLEAEL